MKTRCYFRLQLSLYNRAMVIIDRKRTQGEKQLTIGKVLGRLLQTWVNEQEHAWSEPDKPPADPF